MVAGLVAGVTAAAAGGLSSAFAAASVAKAVVAPASGFTATATSVDGTLSYQGTAVDRGTTVLVFTTASVTLHHLDVSTPCQTAGGTGVTATEATSSTAMDLQGTTGHPVRLNLTSLDATGLSSPYTVANPPAAGYSLTTPTNLDISGTLIVAAQADGQTSEVAVIC